MRSKTDTAMVEFGTREQMFQAVDNLKYFFPSLSFSLLDPCLILPLGNQ